MKNVKEFFVCPHCGKPVVPRDELEEHLAEYLEGHGSYCSHCGKNLASAYDEALAELR